MIVQFAGGLCNQMFQFAFGQSISAKRNEPVLYWKKDLDRGCARAYSLGAFCGTPQFSIAEPTSAWVERTFKFDPEVYDAPYGSYFVGNWQTEKYFDIPVVRALFQLCNPVSAATARVADEISSRSHHSCFVHIRRTDYLLPNTAAYHGNMTMDYYQRAMAYVRERDPNVTFFVFSDDPAWCRSNFPGLRVVDHNKMGSGDNGPGQEHEDLHLMSLCRHAIFPNSSFGWWAAWLGDTQENRIVIAPKQWFRTPTLDFSDVVPERWVKM